MPATAAKVAKSQVAEAQQWLSHLPGNVSNAIDGGLDATRRTLKRGLRTAEELSDETRHRVKRHPFRALAVSVAVGVGTGFLVGWAVTRRRRSRRFW